MNLEIRNLKRAGCFVLAVVMVLTMAACAAAPATQTEQPEQTEATTAETMPPELLNTMTGEELMKELGIGWNLGNTFDAPEGETSWGNPFTTEEMLIKIKELGFNTIRIPISWGKHVSVAPDYTIKADFMNRIDTVVNQALNAGLYVIINSHHDNGIYMPKLENAAKGKAYLSAIWKQIAEHFKDADEHLIFQGMNEPRIEGTYYEWNVDSKNADCMAAVEVVNELNQTVVDAIRSTGGRNADRFIIVSPYVANPGAATMTAFRLPEDSVEGKLIVSIHAYTPYNLCLNLKSDEKTFAVNHLSEIKNFMKSVNYRFVQKGVPVIIDEMGCLDKGNPEARYEWAKAYVSAAAEYGMPCVWWDNGALNSEGENFGLFDRENLEVFAASQSAYQGLMDGLNAN